MQQQVTLFFFPKNSARKRFNSQKRPRYKKSFNKGQDKKTLKTKKAKIQRAHADTKKEIKELCLSKVMSVLEANDLN